MSFNICRGTLLQINEERGAGRMLAPRSHHSTTPGRHLSLARRALSQALTFRGCVGAGRSLSSLFVPDQLRCAAGARIVDDVVVAVTQKY
jgi:hypothetical protein